MKHIIILAVIAFFSVSPFLGMYFFWMLEGFPNNVNEGNRWYGVLPWLIFYTFPIGFLGFVSYALYALYRG